MKNSIVILLMATLTSCAGYYKRADYISNNCYIGMTISDFKKIKSNNAKIATIEKGYTVYRINNRSAMDGSVVESFFYYFDENNKLVKIDTGQFKQQRYQIEVINN